MGLAIIGNGGVIAEVDANHRALRVAQRPLDVGSLGAYRANPVTGTMAAGLAAASPIFAFRWGDATRFCLIRSVRVGIQALTAFTAGNGLLEMFLARSFTASDTGGGAVTITGNNQKLKTAMGTSLVTDLRMSTTATLTAGTRTLDANAFASLNFTVNATANSAQLVGQQLLYDPDTASEWPPVFAQNEGFIIRATVPATGTWNGYVAVYWEELTAFP
jgi:hypothetical protein